MALVEGCKHAIEVSIPVDIVSTETEKVAADFQKKARLPGFRPGKAPLAMIRKNFAPGIREQVRDNLIPRFLDQQIEQDHLKVVSRPSIVDLHFKEGEPLTFKAEFEVAPEFELGEYRGVEIPYTEASVSDEDLDRQIELRREAKATYANVDPRPVEEGDFAVISLESISGTDQPVKSDELQIEVGGEDTLASFNENLRGMTPGEEKTFDVVYPEDYGQEKLAGKTVTFQVLLKGIRRKVLPDLNDEFAQDLGDYRSLDELRDATRKLVLRDREMREQQKAKEQIIDRLVDAHSFAVPEVYVDQQIEKRVMQRLENLLHEGVDVSQFKPDWNKLRELHGESARREVMASHILGRIAEREGIYASQDEVDRQIEQIARQERQPVPVVRKRLEGDGGIGRIANFVRTEKVLAFLFEQARKTAD